MCWSRSWPETEALALQLGLGWPLRRIPAPSRGSGSPAHMRAAGQRALPRLQHYCEPSDSSKGIGLLFPIGYGIAYPTPTDPPAGPSWTNCRLTRGMVSTAGTTRDPARFSLDHFANHVTTVRRNRLLKRLSPGRSCDAGPGSLGPQRTDRVIGFPARGRVATSTGLQPVHRSLGPAISPPPPSGPPSPGRPGHRLLNFNDQSSGRTLTSVLAELPGVRRDEDGAEAPSLSDY